MKGRYHSCAIRTKSVIPIIIRQRIRISQSTARQSFSRRQAIVSRLLNPNKAHIHESRPKTGRPGRWSRYRTDLAELSHEHVWYGGFLIHHKRAEKDDVPVVEAKESLGCKMDALTIFLQVTDSLGPPCDADEVKSYCRDCASIQDIQNGIGAARTGPVAWIDDRNSPNLTGSGSVRLRGQLLTLTELLGHLKQHVRERYQTYPSAPYPRYTLKPTKY